MVCNYESRGDSFQKGRYQSKDADSGYIYARAKAPRTKWQLARRDVSTEVPFKSNYHAVYSTGQVKKSSGQVKTF